MLVFGEHMMFLEGNMQFVVANIQFSIRKVNLAE